MRCVSPVLPRTELTLSCSVRTNSTHSDRRGGITKQNAEELWLAGGEEKRDQEAVSFKVKKTDSSEHNITERAVNFAKSFGLNLL